jgi:hydroxypyruvate isomerase
VPKFAANLSMIFTGVPFPKHFAAAVKVIEYALALETAKVHCTTG